LNVALQDYAGGKDCVIFLIDCSRSMFDEFDQGTFFHHCIQAAQSTLTNKIITSMKDLVGIVFYASVCSCMLCLHVCMRASGRVGRLHVCCTLNAIVDKPSHLLMHRPFSRLPFACLRALILSLPSFLSTSLIPCSCYLASLVIV